MENKYYIQKTISKEGGWAEKLCEAMESLTLIIYREDRYKRFEEGDAEHCRNGFTFRIYSGDDTRVEWLVVEINGIVMFYEKCVLKIPCFNCKFPSDCRNCQWFEEIGKEYL